MMSFNTQDMTNLMVVLGNTSRINRLTASEIETQMHNLFNFPITGNQQKTRALIKFSIAQGNLIKSSTNPAGFWLSNDRQEILNNIESLKRRSFKTMESAVRLKDTWNRNNPHNLI